jgi:hypothetical protein
VLCLVSSPTYDPELLVGRVRNTNYGILQRDPIKPLFDRALQAQYPPGSIYKIVQSLIALDEGVIDVNTGFPCRNRSSGATTIRWPATSSTRSNTRATPISIRSSNGWWSRTRTRTASRMQPSACAEWHEYMLTFGLGQRLPIDLPSAKGGNIPDVAYYDRKYGKEGWAFSTIYSVSIGQGEVLVAPLQMANLAAIFANKGWYYDPHVVRAVGHPDSLQQKYLTKHNTGVDPKWYDPSRKVCGGWSKNPVERRAMRASKASPYAVNRHGREPTWTGPCRVRLLRTHGGPEDRHGGVRGEQRLRRYVGRTDRQPAHRAIPHRHHQAPRGGEAHVGGGPDRQGGHLREEGEAKKPRRR